MACKVVKFQFIGRVNLQGGNVGCLELFGQGNDSDTDRNGSFRNEHTATAAAAAQLALLLNPVTLMVSLL